MRSWRRSPVRWRSTRARRHAAEDAEDAHTAGDAEDEPHWLQGFDRAELVGTIGARYRDLARHDPGQAPGAVDYLGRALQLRDPTRARNRAFDLVALGRAQLITGEPEESAATVKGAVQHVDPNRPTRLHRKMREWHGEAAPFATVPTVAQVRETVFDAVRRSGSATA